MKERFVLVAHHKYGLQKLADKSEINIRLLNDYPFISFNSNQHIFNITEFALKNAGVRVRAVVRTQSFLDAMELAERGVGLTIFSLYYVMK